jgi:hypothetical protein
VVLSQKLHSGLASVICTTLGLPDLAAVQARHSTLALAASMLNWVATAKQQKLKLGQAPQALADCLRQLAASGAAASAAAAAAASSPAAAAAADPAAAVGMAGGLSAPPSACSQHQFTVSDQHTNLLLCDGVRADVVQSDIRAFMAVAPLIAHLPELRARMLCSPAPALCHLGLQLLTSRPGAAVAGLVVAYQPAWTMEHWQQAIDVLRVLHTAPAYTMAVFLPSWLQVGDMEAILRRAEYATVVCVWQRPPLKVTLCCDAPGNTAATAVLQKLTLSVSPPRSCVRVQGLALRAVPALSAPLLLAQHGPPASNVYHPPAEGATSLFVAAAEPAAKSCIDHLPLLDADSTTDSPMALHQQLFQRFTDTGDTVLDLTCTGGALRAVCSAAIRQQAAGRSVVSIVDSARVFSSLSAELRAAGQRAAPILDADDDDEVLPAAPALAAPKSGKDMQQQPPPEEQSQSQPQDERQPEQQAMDLGSN